MHEKPDVVEDQILNFNRYFSDSSIVLHLHTSFQWNGADPESSIKRWSKFDNVIVNPKSVRTEWGNLFRAHHENFKYAASVKKFDYFCLHSSSDLFVRKGAASIIEGYDCGVSLVAPQPTFGFDLIAEGDPVFKAICRDCGAKELWTSQVEGTYYRAEVFQELINRIERHYHFDETLGYVHEEIYYPTIAASLDLNRGTPYLMREDRTHLPKFDKSLVDQIANGELEDHHMKRWKLGREVDSLVWRGSEICALRPVPREVNDPLRITIRERAAA